MSDNENNNTDNNQHNRLKMILHDVNLQGERVHIRNLKDIDYGEFAGLFADEEVLYYYLPGKVKTYSETEIESLMADWNDLDEAFVFTVLIGTKVIGIITCESVDLDMEHAEVGIALISTSERGKGLATEAMTIFINYLFEALQLHRINARIISGNQASFRLFERLGFMHEGLQREYVRRGSTYLDMNIFGLLAQDWLQTNSK